MISRFGQQGDYLSRVRCIKANVDPKWFRRNPGRSQQWDLRLETSRGKYNRSLKKPKQAPVGDEIATVVHAYGVG